MTIMELKTYVSWDSIESLYHPFSRRRGFLMKLLFLGITFEMFYFAFLFENIVISKTGSYSLAVSTLVATNHTANINVGSGTELFVKELNIAGFNPKIIKKITRVSLAGSGVLVSLNGDNIQVFEYSDSQTAMEKGTEFTKIYLADTSKNRWKDTMHIYIRENILVFYMGKDKNILNTLNLNKNINLLALSGK